ncbi:MAG: L,D-transpeptidase [Chloroflexi bacterium]|nr:L,D-transpeptidase [Chloroflexota bacterium]
MKNARWGKILFPSFFIFFISVAAWTAVSFPAFMWTATETPTPPAPPFAVVQVKKPSPAPTNSPIPSATPHVEETFPTPSPLPLLLAEIVADTPVPEGRSDSTPYDPLPVYSGNKSILVDISEQHMYVYEDGALINDFVASTGMNNSTRAGTFNVLDKIPNAYGATWNIWMPYWLGIYWSGNMENGIHALPILPNGATLWAGYLGAPITYGCVALGTYEAEWLYNWVEIGAPVEIRW